MPSYPRITRVAQVFVQNQTFENYIVINGQKVRPFRRPGTDGTDIYGWEQELDGQWVITLDRVND